MSVVGSRNLPPSEPLINHDRNMILGCSTCDDFVVVSGCFTCNDFVVASGCFTKSYRRVIPPGLCPLGIPTGYHILTCFMNPADSHVSCLSMPNFHYSTNTCQCQIIISITDHNRYSPFLQCCIQTGEDFFYRGDHFGVGGWYDSNE